MKQLFRWLCAGVFGGSAMFAAGQSPPFHYQGRLTDATGPVSGFHDFQVGLYDAATGGIQQGQTLTFEKVWVTNGLFVLRLDFGREAFPGADRWLDFRVKPQTGTEYTPFPARQPILATPYALRASGVAPGAVTSAALADGSVTAAKLAPGAVSGLSAPDGTPANAVVVDGDGAVGVGTAAPRAGLDVARGATMSAPRVVIRHALGFPTRVVAEGHLVASMAEQRAGNDKVTRIVELLDVSEQWPNIVATLEPGAFGLDASWAPTIVAMKGEWLAVGSYDSVQLVNVADPVTPKFGALMRDGMGGFDRLEQVSALAFGEGVLVIASGEGLTFVDLREPANPVVGASVRDGQFGFNEVADVRAMAVQGSLLALISYQDSAMTLVDIASPSNPRVLGVAKDGSGGFTALRSCSGLAMSGSLAVVTADSPENGAITFVDVSNPATPRLLKEIRAERFGDGTTGPGWNDAAFVGSGRMAVASSRAGSISILDLANPREPRIESSVRHGIGSAGRIGDPTFLAWTGDTLLAASPNEGLLVGLDLSATATAGLVSSHRVGVGTAIPQAALHVVGDLVVEDGEVADLNVSRVELGIHATAEMDGVAIGGAARSLGFGSLALGSMATAVGPSSVAMAQQSRAVGYGALALGVTTEAVGDVSVALGASARSLGRSAAALGRSTEAQSFGETVLGYYNETRREFDPEQPRPGDPLLVVGNGNWDARANALTMLKNGNVGLGAVVQPTHRLQLPNTPGAAGSGMASAWLTYSDRRLKDAVAPLERGLDTVMALHPVAYDLRPGRLENGRVEVGAERRRDIGFIAQEVEQALPEAVARPRDPDQEFWALDYQRLIPVLTRAIQELKGENDALKRRIEALERRGEDRDLRTLDAPVAEGSSATPR